MDAGGGGVYAGVGAAMGISALGFMGNIGRSYVSRHRDHHQYR